MSKLKNYIEVETEDGSTTLFSKEYNESCHSTSGARNETQTHYIQGCKIAEKAKLGTLNILEVGFGTGIGLDETIKAVTKSHVNFVSLEIDQELAEYSLEKLEIPFKRIEENITYLEATYNNFTIYILCGDAKETLRKFNKNIKFNAIYQDAFSVRRNPELWTVEWFKLLYDLSESDCIMSTYSSSSSIRKSMLNAGWPLQSGVKFGPKRSSTRADRSLESEQSILDQLERSPAIAITDNNYKDFLKRD